MEAGFNRLNDVTILQASQGLASYITSLNTKTQQSVVIGHDHRLNSKRFADITATAFLLKGFKVYYLESFIEGKGSDIVPTPLVPFAVDYFKSDCGIMITASHNPAQDNGYKVYWNNGCQIIPPYDQSIAESILQNLRPADNAWDIDNVFKISKENKSLLFSKEEILTAYLLHINANLLKTKVPDVKFIYTPMHGVGLEVFSKVISMLGTNSLLTVGEQAQPDPYFPTVKFPNPEEKGALDLAMKKADEQGIDLVLANDPDADRFSAAVKTNGKWRQLTGNEIGFLFADYIYNTYEGELSKVYFINSTVSSQMIASMCLKRGLNYADTLTGFKWIGNKAIDLEKQGYKVPFGYEEAIGFMFNGIHDKDGIAAAVVFLQMVQFWKENNTSAIEVLEKGFENFGYFKEYNSYYIVPQLPLTKIIFDTIRHEKKVGSASFPDHLGQYSITYWRDLTIGFESDTINNVPLLPIDSSSQMITAKLLTDNNTEYIRFTMRGSGTEPKLKIYIEARADTEDRATFLAKDVWDTLRKEWFKPDETGLQEA
ncbi:Phosphoglucosamine mutase [Wickerhamomyces ciferrii]|uniref:phosphopentomutase n=1 Tax=Wickerhamomyces ciferrii (strain ATCC 14091 / BCRC 22168 / CBS 111 / JCM 3599 / NBRC 0793 / NRRL Y-1031 F-60-10) TaxID=1206466 RepID=K0KWI7_WICCF|nr:Phosphoglucosamine mutase [Wickerhamomyces ciferrii]CCH46357.1 Phosphoglucosamine mutase [Wickerhamomyces ciferrii]